MFLNIYEILDILVMTFILGYIFMSALKPQLKDEDVLERYTKKRRGFDWDALWFAASVTAPTILLHELGHKIVAMSYGLTSTFHAACSTANLANGTFFTFYCNLTIVTVILKTVGVGFLFFIPGFVQTAGITTYWQQFTIALAGPLINLAFFIVAWALLKSKKYKFKSKTVHYLTLTKNINLFLFIFNMIPIPGFDGFSTFSALYHMIF